MTSGRGNGSTAPTGGLKVTLGPNLFNWQPDRWRDFYFRIADEAPVDTVHLGETVCAKREPFLVDVLPPVIERLQAAGKEIVWSSPCLVVTERERKALRSLVESTSFLMEASETGCIALLSGRDHAIAPTVNVYNEGALAFLAGRGARRVCLNAELPKASVAALCAAAAKLGVEIELQVFGRAPLAISARCYHARSRGLHKDSCQFVCGEDPDGQTIRTLDNEPFLAINGTQTLTDAYLMLGGELSDLKAAGVIRYRLSPHTCDMVAATTIVREALDGKLSDREAARGLAALIPDVRLANGAYHQMEGWRYLAAAGMGSHPE